MITVKTRVNIIGNSVRVKKNGKFLCKASVSHVANNPTSVEQSLYYCINRIHELENKLAHLETSDKRLMDEHEMRCQFAKLNIDLMRADLWTRIKWIFTGVR